MAFDRINDWYTNAEGRGGDGFRYDWENDDQPDSTPDSWLDWYEPKDWGTISRPARRPANPTAFTQRELAKAARALQKRMRGIKDETIARHLLRSGWPDATAEQVRKALRAHPAQPGEQPAPGIHYLPRKTEPARNKQQPSHGTITVISPPTATREAAKTSTAVRKQPSLAEVTRAVRAKYPLLGIKKLTNQVQVRGWPTATAQQVQAVLKPPPPTAPVRSRQTPVRSRPTMVAPLAARAPHPDACFACGVVPSLLGMCRCS